MIICPRCGEKILDSEIDSEKMVASIQGRKVVCENCMEIMKDEIIGWAKEWSENDECI